MTNLDALLTTGTAIPVNTMVDSLEYQEQKVVAEKYEELVESICAIITQPSKPVIHAPVSLGKDSKLVLVASIEAYARCIEEGSVEAKRPLIVTTVDTNVEAVPMVMMIKYSVPRITEYAKLRGVNLHYAVVKPRLGDEYFIRWASAQKFIPNPTRSGDCSVILKVDVSKRHMKELFKAVGAMVGYAKAPKVQLLGSRDDESARRKANITKADLRDNPIAHLDSVEVSRKDNQKLYQFAPIADWTTEQVFLAHQLAGTRPVTQSLLGNTKPIINSYFPNHGLTLAIYGNGSNEACEVVVGGKQGASCNGKAARFGCYVCTMVGNRDSSSEALAELPRWSVLGGKNAVAIRDYLFRLSTNVKARAFHAKAIDEVGYNRIALQPNVLKARYLEKMVWYASALAVDSSLHAEEFRDMVKQGRAMEHKGMQDIATDPTLTPDVKEQFLEMYQEVAQEPLYTCFSQEHALLLSFRWLADGVATTSMKPISIFQRVVNGERLPLPMTNAEYESKYGKIKMANQLPEAVMIPFHTKQYEAQFSPVTSPRFLSYWKRPLGVLDVFDGVYNCQAQTVANATLPLAVQGANAKIDDSGELEVSFSKVQLLGRNVNAKLMGMIGETFDEQLKDYFRVEVGRMMRENATYAETADSIARPRKITLQMPYFKEAQIGWMQNASESEVKAHSDKTERVIKRTAKGIERGLTRLNFYPPKAEPANLRQSMVPVTDVVMDFGQHTQFYGLVDAVSDRVTTIYNTEDYAMESLYISPEAFDYWLRAGGWDRCLDIHDRELRMRLRNAKLEKSGIGRGYRKIRAYAGSGYAHQLLNETGLGINAQYSQTLRDVLRRTDLLSEVGAYDFASQAQAQLLAYEGGISMEQHRKDKVRCVQELRKARNAARAKARMIKSSTYIAEIQGALGFGKDVARIINEGLHAHLGGFVDTAEVPRVRQLATARAFMAINAPKFGGFNDFCKFVFNAETNASINANPQKMVELNAIYTQSLKELVGELNGLSATWAVMVQNLKAFEEALKGDTDHIELWKEFANTHLTLAQAQVTYYPEGYRARREKMIADAQKHIALIEKVMGELDELITSANAGINSSSAKMVKSLKGTNRLNFLKLVA